METLKKAISLNCTKGPGSQIEGLGVLCWPSRVETLVATEKRSFSYEQLVRTQHQHACRIREQGADGVVLLAEVDPVLTVGRRARGFTQPQKGAPLLDVDRGGLITWHGPGQWVVFAVERLERLTGDSKGVRKAVFGLLELAQAVSRDLGVETQIHECPGVGLYGPKGKLASVGVQVDRGVLLHGLSINVERRPESFQGLERPCGLDQPIEFLSDQVPGAGLMGRAKESILNCLQRVRNG